MGKRINRATLANLANRTLNLGYVGENEHTQIVIDCTDVFWDYPDALYSMVVEPPTGDMYPVTLTKENHTLVWLITASDVANAGGGRFQLTFTDDGEIIRSAIGSISVAGSLEGAGGEAPTPIENWMDEANEKLAEVDQALENLHGIPAGGTEGKFLMKSSGSDFDVEWGDATVSDEKVEEAVDAWLDENITNPDSPPLDRSLSSSSAAAPADMVGDLKSQIALKGLPDGGSSGQILTKATGADYDVEWSPVGTPSDEQVDEAVSDWLDDHPEATTTVVDGAITMPKLNSALQNKIVVQQDTEKEEFHNVSPTSVSFYPDDRLTGVTAKYSASKNLVIGRYATGLTNGITGTLSGNLLNLSGTGTGQYLAINKSDAQTLAGIQGKTFHAYLYIKKSTSWELSSNCFFYDGKKLRGRQYYTSGGNALIGWTDLGEITFAEDATQLLFKFDSLNGAVFASGDCIWIGLYETALTDTQTAVTGDDPYTISVTGLSSIDTATHESTAKHVVSTKDYVDEHTPDIIGYWTDHIYALPEDFGAIGDGVADDGTAIADCLVYAATSGKAVKGFGKYKTSSTITIETRNADVYLKEIVYTGNNAAVTLVNREIVFEFHTVTSSGTGIVFSSSGNISASACQVKGNKIESASHCIQIDDSTYYNTVDVRYLRTTNGNCIHRNIVSVGSGEYVFRSSSCYCPNGYVSHDVTVSKFYDFTVEGDCKYGLLNPVMCECIGWRHREQTDILGRKIAEVETETRTNGALIIFTRPPNDGGYGFKYIATDKIPFTSIDLSAISGYDSESNAGEWMKMAWNGIDLGTPVCGIYAFANDFVCNNLYFIGNNKVCVIDGRKKVDVTAYSIIDLKHLDSNNLQELQTYRTLMPYMATDFVIGISHLDLYLNASYGAIGFNDITITQENGNTCTVYDKQGNVLFDGTNEGNGKWRLQCVMDRSSYGRCTVTLSSWWGYDGTNEFWEITKLA